MNAIAALGPSSRLRTALASRSTLPIVLLSSVLVGVVGWRAWLAHSALQLPGTPASAEAIEAAWGVRVTQIAVTADGGLVDFRFQIIDPDKAGPLFSLAKRPILINEATGQRVESLMHPPHSYNLAPGVTQYFIFNNNGGALQPGASVAVVLGDLRLEHFSAK